MGNDDFFRQNAVFSGDHEVINAAPDVFRCVWVGKGASAVEGLEMVDQRASHVVHFDVGFTFQVREDEVHLAIVGVRDDVKASRCVVFLEVIIRAKEPIATFGA